MIQRRLKPELSTNERLILDFCRRFIASNGYPPSNREIGAGCDISSTSVVDYGLGLLERRGLLTRVPHITRSIVLLEACPTCHRPMGMGDRPLGDNHFDCTTNRP